MNKAEKLTREFIEGQLDASQAAVEAALVAIYDRQSAEEKVGRYSVLTNGVGFSKFDADFCTSLVQQIKRGRPLTPNQLPHARRKMKRYWKQLITVMTTDAPIPLVEPPAPVKSSVIDRTKHARIPDPSERSAGVVGYHEASELYGSW